MQARIQGGWNGWIFTPLFLSPLLSFFFLSLKYWNNIWFLWHYYKNSPPISKSWIRPCHGYHLLVSCGCMLCTRILFPLLHIIDVFLCLFFRRFCFSLPCACFTWNKLTNLYLQCSLFLTIDLLFIDQSSRKISIFGFDEHGEGEWNYSFSLILFTRREGYTSTHTFPLFSFVVFTRQLGLPRWACYPIYVLIGKWELLLLL